MLSSSTRRIVFGRKGSNSPLSASTTPLPRPCVLLRISRRSRRPIRLLRSMTVVPMHGCLNDNTKDRDGFHSGHPPPNNPPGVRELSSPSRCPFTPPQKRTLVERVRTSALCQKRTLRSATSVSAKCQIQIEVSSEPTNARRSESPSLPLRRPGTLREHPVRS